MPGIVPLATQWPGRGPASVPEKALHTPQQDADRILFSEPLRRQLERAYNIQNNDLVDSTLIELLRILWLPQPRNAAGSSFQSFAEFFIL